MIINNNFFLSSQHLSPPIKNQSLLIHTDVAVIWENNAWYLVSGAFKKKQLLKDSAHWQEVRINDNYLYFRKDDWVDWSINKCHVAYGWLRGERTQHCKAWYRKSITDLDKPAQKVSWANFHAPDIRFDKKNMYLSNLRVNLWLPSGGVWYWYRYPKDQPLSEDGKEVTWYPSDNTSLLKKDYALLVDFNDLQLNITAVDDNVHQTNVTSLNQQPQPIFKNKPFKLTFKLTHHSKHFTNQVLKHLFFELNFRAGNKSPWKKQKLTFTKQNQFQTTMLVDQINSQHVDKHYYFFVTINNQLIPPLQKPFYINSFDKTKITLHNNIYQYLYHYHNTTDQLITYFTDQQNVKKTAYYFDDQINWHILLDNTLKNIIINGEPAITIANKIVIKNSSPKLPYQITLKNNQIMFTFTQPNDYKIVVNDQYGNTKIINFTLFNKALAQNFFWAKNNLIKDYVWRTIDQQTVKIYYTPHQQIQLQNKFPHFIKSTQLSIKEKDIWKPLPLSDQVVNKNLYNQPGLNTTLLKLTVVKINHQHQDFYLQLGSDQVPNNITPRQLTWVKFFNIDDATINQLDHQMLTHQLNIIKNQHHHQMHSWLTNITNYHPQLTAAFIKHQLLNVNGYEHQNIVRDVIDINDTTISSFITFSNFWNHWTKGILEKTIIKAKLFLTAQIDDGFKNAHFKDWQTKEAIILKLHNWTRPISKAARDNYLNLQKKYEEIIINAYNKYQAQLDEQITWTNLMILFGVVAGSMIFFVGLIIICFYIRNRNKRALIINADQLESDAWTDDDDHDEYDISE